MTEGVCMNGKRVGRLLAAVLALATATAGIATSLAVAQTGSSAPVRKCLSDAKAAPYLLANGYSRGGKLVGSTFCNDGATATATVAGKPYSFKGGVCFRQGDEFNVQIGTTVDFKRVKSDPPGFRVSDVAPGGVVKDGVWFGLTNAGKVIEWGFGDVKLKVGKGSAPKGTFSGVELKLVNGKLTKIPASGSFTCRRVLKVPS
jgi:hypothetical protein